MEGKLFGIGLGNTIGIIFTVMLMILVLKVTFAKYPVKGVSEAVHAL